MKNIYLYPTNTTVNLVGFNEKELNDRVCELLKTKILTNTNLNAIIIDEDNIKPSEDDLKIIISHGDKIFTEWRDKEFGSYIYCYNTSLNSFSKEISNQMKRSMKYAKHVDIVSKDTNENKIHIVGPSIFNRTELMISKTENGINNYANSIYNSIIKVFNIPALSDKIYIKNIDDEQRKKTLTNANFIIDNDRKTAAKFNINIPYPTAKLAQISKKFFVAKNLNETAIFTSSNIQSAITECEKYYDYIVFNEEKRILYKSMKYKKILK